MPFGPRDVAGVLASLSYAGPSASRVGASAVVARLRRSVAWSDRRLAALSTLPEASAQVAASSTIVVDRRGLIRSVGSLLDNFEDTRTPLVLAAEAVILRALAKAATGIWDVRTGRRILVAPNVLADAQRYAHRRARGRDRPPPVGRRGAADRSRVRGSVRVAGACALTPRAVWGRTRAAPCAPAPWRCALF